jgi:hypothetical protein
MRTEKSPFWSCSAAFTIRRTGRSTKNLLRRPSITVKIRLKSSTFKKVATAACSKLSRVKTMPVVVVMILRNKTMQQVMAKAIKRKKQRYRLNNKSHDLPFLVFPLI